ncbi:unnamed protein product [Lactuca virosa]|uniref:Uncharacterized protein n=1 Tax=Lactuca virosa TaxID=75947 RepID=A0AAU9P536_9ASTR|nr:unnamed protein product [Lactuca virosa]
MSWEGQLESKWMYERKTGQQGRTKSPFFQSKVRLLTNGKSNHLSPIDLILKKNQTRVQNFPFFYPWWWDDHINAETIGGDIQHKGRKERVKRAIIRAWGVKMVNMEDSNETGVEGINLTPIMGQKTNDQKENEDEEENLKKKMIMMKSTGSGLLA